MWVGFVKNLAPGRFAESAKNLQSQRAKRSETAVVVVLCSWLALSKKPCLSIEVTLAVVVVVVVVGTRPCTRVLQLRVKRSRV